MLSFWEKLMILVVMILLVCSKSRDDGLKQAAQKLNDALQKLNDLNLRIAVLEHKNTICKKALDETKLYAKEIPFEEEEEGPSNNNKGSDGVLNGSLQLDKVIAGSWTSVEQRRKEMGGDDAGDDLLLNLFTNANVDMLNRIKHEFSLEREEKADDNENDQLVSTSP